MLFRSGKKTIFRRAVGVVFGSCLYRVIVAIALRFNLPASALKLVSAVIVAVAIASPQIKKMVAFQRQKGAAMAQIRAARRAAKGGDR